MNVRYCVHHKETVGEAHRDTQVAFIAGGYWPSSAQNFATFLGTYDI